MMKATLITEAKKEMKGIESKSQLKRLYRKYLGPQGLITKELLRIPSLHASMRKTQSKSINQIHKTFVSLYNKREEELSD